MYVVVYVIFVPIVLSFGQHNSQALPDIIKNCTNSTNSTSCSLTYEQVYQNLSKSENNFNISNALYPGRSKASSLHVLVNVYGPDKTKDCEPAQYAWSVSCLYAAVPASVLGFLSLGSILVSHRTQHLDLHIPLFCCNVSENKEEREEKIKGFLTRVLGELQDLAVSPGIRDPTLNTVKCITEGHKPSMDAAGLFIRICVLWFSLGFVLISSPLLSKYVVGMKDNVNQKEEKRKEKAKSLEEEKQEEEKEKNTLEALCILCCVLSVLGVILLLLALVCSMCHWIGQDLKGSFDIPIILILIILYSFILPFILTNFDGNISICECGENYFCLPIVVISTIVMSCHFCWLMTGIMLNPTWGLTVALLASVILAAFMYAVYLYLKTVKTDKTKVNKWQPFLFFGAGFLAVLFLVVIIVFAGQSYNSNETADAVLKTSLLYFIGAFVSWISWKKQAPHCCLACKQASRVCSHGTSAKRRDGLHPPAGHEPDTSASGSNQGAGGVVNQNNSSPAANGQQPPAGHEPDTSASGIVEVDVHEMQTLLPQTQ